MSEQQKRDVDLDAAIDAVAREMTNLEAPASLRAEVLARIEAPAAGRWLGWQRWSLAAGAAVVVIAAVAIWWPTGPGDVRGTGRQAGVTDAPSVRSAEFQPGVSDAPSGRSAGLQARGTGTAAVRDIGLPRPEPGQREARGTGSASVRGTEPEPRVDEATPDFGPAPLAGPPPIAIDALAPGAIDIAEMQVPALEQIQPIAIKDIPIGSTDPQRR